MIQQNKFRTILLNIEQVNEQVSNAIKDSADLKSAIVTLDHTT